MVNCPNCGNSRIESDAASGNAFCTSCGTVVEENTIVSEITFGESSSGAAVVQGSFLSGDATGARISGPFRNQSSENSREQTLRKGRQRVNALANAMKLPERLAEQGMRYFTLAVTNNFIRGRRSQYVVATCLYIVCRYEKTSHMLIDFSDMLQINVFVLGSTFLKFVKLLHIQIPLVDPSLYIARFAAMLDFGEDTHKVASDATRLVARMKRDWIDTGRRPAGVCGASLIIAGRMNNYRRSMMEIVHVVKVAETTVQQRLLDFSRTASANLTVEDFGKVWLEKSENPPAFERDKKKKKKKKGGVTGKAKGRKRKAGFEGEENSEEEEEEEEAADSEDEDEDMEDMEEDEEAAVRTLVTMKDPDPKDDDGVFKRPYPINGLASPPSTQVPGTSIAGAIDPALSADSTTRDLGQATPPSTQAPQSETNGLFCADDEEADAARVKEIQDDVESMLNSEDLREVEASELSRRANLASTTAHKTTHADTNAETLSDVDDDEIDSILLDEASIKIKTQVWMQNNLDYLADQERKRLKSETDKKNGIKSHHAKKRRRTKPRDSSAAGLPASPAESARQMLEERTFSKKINYAAMDHLFE